MQAARKGETMIQSVEMDEETRKRANEEMDKAIKADPFIWYVLNKPWTKGISRRLDELFARRKDSGNASS